MLKQPTIDKTPTMSRQTYIITGHSETICSLIEDTLSQIGMLTIKGHGDDKEDPIRLGRKLLNINGIDIDKENGLPKKSQEISINLTCRSLMADFLIKNANHKFSGWSDPNALYLIEEWAAVEPRAKFIFAYTSPTDFIVETLQDAQHDNIETAKLIESWHNYNQRLINAYRTFENRAILVNPTATSFRRNRFLNLVRDVLRPPTAIHLTPDFTINKGKFVPNIAKPCPNEDDWTTRQITSALTYRLANLIVERDKRANELYSRLEATATLPAENVDIRRYDDEKLIDLIRILDAKSEDTLNRISAVTKQNNKLRDRVYKLKKERKTLIGNNYDLEAKINALTSDIKDIRNKANANNESLQLQIEEKQSKIQKLESRIEHYLITISNLEETIEANERKSDGLLEQLHIVQKKYEKYYIESTTRTGAANRVKNHLSYRLGSQMVKNSRSLIGWIWMPIAMLLEIRSYRKNRIYNSYAKLPPIHEYADADEAEKVKRHLSYRLGSVLIQRFKSPIGLITLPYAILREIKQFRENKSILTQ